MLAAPPRQPLPPGPHTRTPQPTNLYSTILIFYVRVVLCAEQQQQQQNSSSNAEQLVPWWQLKAQQSAPPRQTLLHPPGEVARFVADQALYSSKVRSGRSTALGGELDLPQVMQGLGFWCAGFRVLCASWQGSGFLVQGSWQTRRYMQLL